MPKLRFPGFEGEWQKEKLGCISQINPTTGDLPDKFYYIDLESVEAGILLKKSLICKADAPSRAQRVLTVGDILFQTVRPYQLNNYYVNEDFDYPSVASTGYAQLKTQENPAFLYALLHTPNFNNLVLLRCTGSSYPAINSNDLKEIPVYRPSVAEQDRIALFMTLIDNKIKKQRQLVDALKSYKRGLIQRLWQRNFSFVKQNDKWPEMRIDELFDCIIDKGHPEETVLTIIQGVGTVPRDSIDRRISYDKKSVSSYKKVIKDDFILHLRSFEGGLEISNETGIVSPAYTILRVKQKIVPHFFYTYFRSYPFIQDKLRIAVEGIRDGKSINMVSFWAIEIPVPPIDIQKQISDFISQLNKRIDIAISMLDSCEKVKRGLLSNLLI